MFTLGYWHQNYGDDLFLQTLCQRYSDVTFYILANSKFIQGVEELKNLRVIRYGFVLRMLDAILRRLGLPSVTALVGRFRFKDFIEIGGSIFMEEENWLEKYRERVYIQKHCISYSVLGSNFGPYSSPEFKQRYEQLFDSVTQVVFRDRYSKQLFETNNNISWGPDLNFAANLPEEARTKEEDNKKSLSISVINPEWKSSQSEKSVTNRQYVDFLTTVTRNAIQNNFEVHLLSFCEGEGDLKIAEQVKAKFINSPEVIIDNYETLTAMTKQISKSSFLIGCRFHAVVLGLLTGIPTLPVAYGRKTQSLIEDIFSAKLWLSIPELVELKPSEIRSAGVRLPSSDRKRIVTKAEEQFERLDHILKSN